MGIENILSVTFSGVREGEEQEVMAIIGNCGLHTQDITETMLRNFLVARKGDQIVGVAGLEVSAGNALLRSLGVVENHRGRGIAKSLIASVEKYALTRQIDTLYLLTQTAKDFFVKLGYRSIERAKAPREIQSFSEFKSICPDSAVCLYKRLSRA